MKYSVWTLLPKDHNERNEFKRFRINDVIEQYGYFFAIQLFFAIFPILKLLVVRTKRDVVLGIDCAVAILITAVLYWNRQKLGCKFGIGVIVCYVIATL